MQQGWFLAHYDDPLMYNLDASVLKYRAEASPAQRRKAIAIAPLWFTNNDVTSLELEAP